MFRLVLPCSDLEIKTNNVSSDEDNCLIKFHWITKKGFIKSVMWWNNKSINLESTGTWKPKIMCGDWEKEFRVPSLNFYDTCTITGDYLLYNSSLNNHTSVSEDGAFKISFKRMEGVPLYMPYAAYAGHDVKYDVVVTLPFYEVPDVAKELASQNVAKKAAYDKDEKRRTDLKRKADELRAMADELEAESRSSKIIKN